MGLSPVDNPWKEYQLIKIDHENNTVIVPADWIVRTYDAMLVNAAKTPTGFVIDHLYQYGAALSADVVAAGQAVGHAESSLRSALPRHGTQKAGRWVSNLRIDEGYHPLAVADAAELAQA